MTLRNAKPLYNLLPALMVTTGVVIAPRVSEAALAAIGIEPAAGQVVLALLLAAASVGVQRWLRRAEAEDLRQAHRIQRALRRYVPGAVANQLEGGRDIEPGVREVSVLFADIRGFTTFAEEREPAEIFSTVNWYTETVSRIVRRHGGSVVEFGGDGVMALFGAPDPLPDRERAAVEAGRAIVAATSDARKAAGTAGNFPLSVGVGIASGRDFVGNIEAADRVIWSATGNTSNRAARLQSLTRDLDVGIIIDEPTRVAAGAAAADFHSRRQVPIRGLRNPADVHVLG